MHCHIDFQAQGQADSITSRNCFDLLDMVCAINHQSDVCSRGRCPCNRYDILLIPRGIADEQVIKSLRGQVGRFPGGVTHNALKTWIGCQYTA